MDNQDVNSNPDTMPDNEETFIPGGQSVSSRNGITWISQAWNLVKNQLGMWVLLYIIYLASMMGLQMIPLFGLFAGILTPVFIGGVIAVCEKQRTTGQFELGLLFSGFQKNFTSLLGVGALSLGIMILGVIIAFIIGGSTIIHIFLSSQQGEIPAEMLLNNLSTLSLIAFVMFIFYIVITALTWFAPALIVIHNLEFGTAISMSLGAVRKNLLPGFLFFITLSGIAMISVIPLGLGLLIFMPLFLVSYYSSYRDIFIGKEKSSTLIC
ncbi:BPSS1780 family membrane protein [Photorhabdus tasmaniensis]|uniref:BPSS1780 family membrane protein n=1 Tax=Photorhabdus tasmaniensis TaxID=1004159 RepID=UPI004040F165